MKKHLLFSLFLLCFSFLLSSQIQAEVLSDVRKLEVINSSEDILVTLCIHDRNACQCQTSHECCCKCAGCGCPAKNRCERVDKASAQTFDFGENPQRVLIELIDISTGNKITAEGRTTLEATTQQGCYRFQLE
jgi:hypothetical protein